MKDFIYELIPKDRYITRGELVELTNLSDRQVRDFISTIKQEHTVISSSRKKGYRKMIDLNDSSKEQLNEEYQIIKHCINEINSRKKVYNKQLRQLIASLKVIEKKLTL